MYVMASYSMIVMFVKLIGPGKRWEFSGTTTWNIHRAKEQKEVQPRFHRMSWWIEKVDKQSRRKKSMGSSVLKISWKLKGILLPSHFWILIWTFFEFPMFANSLVIGRSCTPKEKANFCSVEFYCGRDYRGWYPRSDRRRKSWQRKANEI